jgi:hypothetical protein
MNLTIAHDVDMSETMINDGVQKMKGGDKRTRSDKRLRPVRRAVSRYGVLENNLIRMKLNNVKRFSPNDIAIRTKYMSPDSISGLLRVTTGVRKIKKGIYEFDENEIKVGGKWLEDELNENQGIGY